MSEHTATLFILEPLAINPFHLPLLGARAPKPEFALPYLDEFAPGIDRLLDGGKPWASPRTLRPIVPEPLRVDKQHESAALVDDDGDHDLWGQAAEAVAGPSRRIFEPIRTWDHIPDTNPYLSEQPMVYEALVSTSLSVSRLKSAAPPKRSSELLRDLMNATTGIASESVRWHVKEARFGVGDGQRVTGVESGTAASSMKLFLELGTAVRRLEIVVETLGASPITPTHHALLHAVSTYLTFVKQRLATAIEEITCDASAGAWNRWTLALSDTHDLSAKLCEVVYWPLFSNKAHPMPTRAPSLLTHLHAHLLAHLATCSPTQQHGSVALALAFVLREASVPLFGLLHQWVGLADSSGIDADPDVEAQPWSDIGVTREKRDDGNWEYSFSTRAMPGFIPKDVKKQLLEAGKSLRALRDASDGQHPLCASTWPVKASWGWGGEHAMTYIDVAAHVRRVDREIEVWKGTLHSRARPSGSASMGNLNRRHTRKTRKSLPAEFILPPSPSKPAPARDLWSLFDLAPGTHLADGDPSPLWAPTPLDSLEAFLAYHADASRPLLPADAPTLPQYVPAHVLAPLTAHAELTARALVSFYLDDLGLLDHLDVLRAFWLAGDVGFAERVAAALFGKDGAGAGEALGLGRRARTRARMGLGAHDAAAAQLDPDAEWGIGLGLGLSERKRWPPGGAELAYALRTTLMDDASVRTREGAGPVAWDGIEDRVSFAVHALPEDDGGRRARWLDPQAIEALDFLYLAYSPPPPIAPLFPPTIMARYQAIHNLLLRISRAEAVVRSMYYDILHLSVADTKVSVDLQHRPTRFASKPKDSLFPDGSGVERQTRVLRLRMAHFVGALATYTVDTAIGANWAVMRRRLERLRTTARAKADCSRPGTPVDDDVFDTDSLDTHEAGTESIEGAEADGDDEGHDGNGPDSDEPRPLAQLRSVDSVVLYHAVVLERIARACLLAPSPGYAATFRLLMALLGLVLDTGKVLKETERGLRGWEDAGERIGTYAREWDDKERVFLHALERLAARAHGKGQEEADEAGAAAESDLRVLLDDEGQRKGAEELGELLLRLRLGKGVDKAARRRAEA